ncbi:hypothetical protein MMC13_003887 [Lambiella insularis]|nr:hypothetical protein [Lambiella insularis]
MTTAATQTLDIRSPSEGPTPSPRVTPISTPIGTPLVTPVTIEPHHHDDSIVHYEDELQQLNSSYQVKWSKVMEEGKYRASSQYEAVSVLLLSWDEDYDDMDVKGEVDKLAQVFDETFQYNVQNTRLKADTERTAQAQINLIVAQFVAFEDRPKKLLIVYYAGHGTPGHMPGHLELFGKSSPHLVKGELNKVIWNRAEDLLVDTRADVLEIFDCCYAGNLGNDRSPPTRAFEYLAATAPGSTTKSPGPNSFTSALIWALEALVADEGRFTTQQLVSKIKNSPGLPSGQRPILSKRSSRVAPSFIMLEPISKDPKRQELIRARSSGNNHDSGAAVLLTLKFMFDTRPSEKQVEVLGRALNEIVEGSAHDLRVSRIMWGGLSSWPRFIIAEAAQRFSLFGSHRRHKRQQSGGSSDSLLVPYDSSHSRQRRGFIPGHNALFISKKSIHDAYHEHLAHEHGDHSVVYHGTMLFLAFWAAAISLVAFLPDKGRGLIGVRGVVSVAGLGFILFYAFLYAFSSL